MRYSVILKPAKEPENSGWYYAHIPALDLTARGFGLEGAMKAARDLVTGWIAEVRSSGEEIPPEKQGFVSRTFRSMSFTPSEAITELKRAGFVEVRQTGSHLFLRHPDGRLTFVARSKPS